jgi:hypothetical protein
MEDAPWVCDGRVGVTLYQIEISDWMGFYSDFLHSSCLNLV